LVSVGGTEGKMEALFAIALAVGWAYYQISSQNSNSSVSSNLKGVFSSFAYMFFIGIVLFVIVMFFVFLFGG
tara:strand:+ start:386 stop:601 length:216 start_codon:yes stop_codon:yes gene_type:complete